ncbi:BCD family MFS transporter [Phenylobacterium sp.]|uniref:BCD family MFS transporter n=1 Tax=Phenylobacterium sp. TaxID=1871053 RepID=UPI0025DE3509|nr:BCD family MFS transporter [Phenylobacterium sp.]
MPAACDTVRLDMTGTPMARLGDPPAPKVSATEPGIPAWSWRNVGVGMLPFADSATPELPLGRLLRLSLFQVTVGMAAVLLIGTLNRVMIVELGLPAWVVATMISLPLVFAPFRMLVGHRSDVHRSVLGWRRVPYIWFGTLMQFGGLAIMPFALILLSGDSRGPPIIGQASAALAFLLAGAGLHMTQTAGLALATDLAPAHARPKVVALLCFMLIVGTVASALSFGVLLKPFSELRLIQVIQGSAVVTMLLNGFALWKQEARNRNRIAEAPGPAFRESWAAYTRTGRAGRRLLAIGLGTVAFSMQDVLLEPYGGKILHLSVSATTTLTAMLAVGGAAGLGLAARSLNRGADPYRVAGFGALAGLAAFTSVIFAAPVGSPLLFALGVALVGFGAGLFAHGTLTASMSMAQGDATGLALGAWGAVQALAAGLAIASGGVLSDTIASLAASGRLGPTLTSPATGYTAVYLIELLLLFATLIAIGPLAGRSDAGQASSSAALTNLAGSTT